MPPLYLVTYLFPPAAFSRKVQAYAEALARSGTEVIVCTAANPRGLAHDHFLDPDLPRPTTPLTVERWPVRWWSPLDRLLAWTGGCADRHGSWQRTVAARLPVLLQRRPGPVLALHPPASTLFGAAAAARAANCPLALDLQDLPLNRRQPRAGRRRRPGRRKGLLEQARVVAVSTEPLRQALIGTYGIAPERVVVRADGHAGPLPAVRPRTWTPPLEALWAGPITAHTQPDTFARLQHLLQRDAPDVAARWRLTFCGPATRYLHRHLLPLLNAGHMEYTGVLPCGALERALARSDVALISPAPQPSPEAIPGRLFDAWAHGLPVVAQLAPGAARDLVRKSRAGLLLPENPAEAARALAEFLLTPGRLADCHRHALAVRSQLQLDAAVVAFASTLRRRLPEAGPP